MKGAGFIEIARRLVAASTPKRADAVIADCGDDYRPLAKALRDRMTFARTKNQNSLLHVWFADIAKHFGDRTAQQVKGECHRDIGLNIRLRDPVFEWVWKNSGAKLPPEKQAKLLATESLHISSAMTTAELSEYMDAIAEQYKPQGVRLTEPEQ